METEFYMPDKVIESYGDSTNAAENLTFVASQPSLDCSTVASRSNTTPNEFVGSSDISLNSNDLSSNSTQDMKPPPKPRSKTHSRPVYETGHRCEACNRTFGRQSSLTQHIKYMHGTAELKHRCPICGKRYATEEKLQTHQQIHTTENKPFPCSRCPRQFQHRGSRNCHFIVHHGKAKFVCNVCGKGFARNDKYLMHTNKHS